MALSWSFRRRLFYIGIISIVFLAIAIPVAVNVFSVPATCFDGKQNGSEAGVDCGGNCNFFCPFQVDPVVILWARSFEVAPGMYNAVAYIENLNSEATERSISYDFDLYDEENVFIVRKSGQTFIAPNTKTAIVEGSIRTGNRIPKRATFSFTEAPNWESSPISPEMIFSISDISQKIERVPSGTRLTAILKNSAFVPIRNVEVSAILFDDTGNALGVSKSFVESIGSNEEIQVFFSWPFFFDNNISYAEIIPRVNPFSIE